MVQLSKLGAGSAPRTHKGIDSHRFNPTGTPLGLDATRH
jgi:hypothetical protein